jgi:hypothetical protein
MKESKATAGYISQSLGAKHCGACKHFIAEGSCRIVEGKIKPAGVCKYYAARGAK